jgi:hypothetical protein
MCISQDKKGLSSSWNSSPYLNESTRVQGYTSEYVGRTGSRELSNISSFYYSYSWNIEMDCRTRLDRPGLNVVWLNGSSLVKRPQLVNRILNLINLISCFYLKLTLILPAVLQKINCVACNVHVQLAVCNFAGSKLKQTNILSTC